MRPVLIFFLFYILGCGSNNKYSDGGFEYPNDILKKDTNLYFYPLKDIKNKRHVFQNYYMYQIYRPFNEPNLSLAPETKEIYRLTYLAGFGDIVIINLTKDNIVVKQGDPSVLYSENITTLSESEKQHFNFLKINYPIDTLGRNPIQKRYLDSLVKLYPQLLKAEYYHNLYEKTLVYSGEKFNYSLSKIKITKAQYKSIVDEINLSGFWKLPYNVECKNPPTDNDGFILEANTRSRYKVVSVSGCPDDTTRFTKACQKLIQFAKMDKEIQLIWDGTIDSVAVLQ